MNGFMERRIDRYYKGKQEEMLQHIEVCKEFFGAFGVKAVDDFDVKVTVFRDELNSPDWKAKECTENVQDLMLQSDLYYYPY